jgi:multiple sugar transport system substrate-binding protein
VPGRPSRPPLGGINLGIGAYTRQPALAYDAALCLAQPANQVVAAEKGGLPPTSEAVYQDPGVRKAFPFSELLRASIQDGGPRPVAPAYGDISLAIQKTFHPENQIDVRAVVSQLRERLAKAAQGRIF